MLCLFTHLSSRFRLLTPSLVCAPPCWFSAPPRLFALVPHHLVYLVCVSLCHVASSSCFPRASSVPAILIRLLKLLVIPTLDRVTDSSSASSLVCTSACTMTAYPCTEPGLDNNQTLQLPDPPRNLVCVIGLPHLCTETSSKSCSWPSLSPSRAFESYALP